MQDRTPVTLTAPDIQESLKILQFRFGQKVDFRPAVVRRGVRYYCVEGQLHAESDIVTWTVIRPGRVGTRQLTK